MTECCRTCRFFAPNARGYTLHEYDTMHYDCMRHAPGPNLAIHLKGESRENVGVFPQVQPRDWCGDYEVSK